MVWLTGIVSPDGTTVFNGVDLGIGNFDVLQFLIWGRTISGPASPTPSQSST